MRTRILFLLACLLLLSSCSLKEEERTSTVQLRSFRAELPENFVPGDPVIGDATRSFVTLETGASAFEANDRALVTDGSNEAIYKYDGSAFQYESGTEPADISAAVAFFPASWVTGRDGKSLQVSLPSSQVRNTVTLSDLPMSGKFYGSGSVCRFYNLCTILKVSAGDGAATSGKTLSGLTFDSHEAGISGEAVYADGKLTMAAAAGKSLAMTGSPASLGASTDWYLILPSQAYPGGFEMTLSFTDGKTYTYATNRTVTLQPGYISHMEAFSCTDFSGGAGTQANPYRIASQADWVELQAKISTAATTDAYRDKYYVLTADIDFAGGSLATIGTEDSQAFTGCFDGDGHTLSNLTLARSTDAERCALFGSLDGGTLKNLSFVNVSTQGTRTANYSAILAAKAVNGSLIENCTVTGATIASGKPYVGVATGYLDASTVRNCTATGITVSGTRTSSEYGVGGLVGIMKSASTVSGCSVSGAVNSEGNNIGGIVGLAHGQPSAFVIENCSFEGTISGRASIGGIVSDITTGTTIRGCTVNATGNGITGSGNNVAGIVAFIADQGDNRNGSMSDCTFRGKVSSSAGYRLAGLFANNQCGMPISDCLVENATISGTASTQVAGAVSAMAGGSRSAISRVTVRQSSVTGARIVGGVVSYINALSSGGVEVTDCAVENTPVTGVKKDLTDANKYCYVGAVAGVVYPGDESPAVSALVRCHSSGATVQSPGLGIGGIVGSLSAPAIVNDCWSNCSVCSLLSDLDGSLYHSGSAGGIAGEIAQGKENNLVINCSYYGGSVSSEGPQYGSVGGIVGLMVYTFEVGTVSENYVVNCFSNPASVTAGGNLGAGGIGGDMCRYIVDNCYSPIDSGHLAVGSNHTYTTASLMGRVNRGGHVVNCYYTYESASTRQQMSATDWIYQATALTDAQMRAEAATVTIPTTEASAPSLVSALNTGATLYNAGGDGIAHHGAPKAGVLAKPWTKVASYPYPVLVGSPLDDGTGTRGGGYKAGFMGDSIFWVWGGGYEGRTDISDDWKGHKAYFVDNAYLNKGVSGNTTTQMLARFDKDLLTANPEVVVILGGTNDIYYALRDKTAPDSEEEMETLACQIRDNLAAMTRKALDAGVSEVYLCSILPVSQYYSYPLKPIAPIRAVNDKIRAYCAATARCTYIDVFASWLNAEGTGAKDGLTYDKLHPTKAGCTELERVISPYIE